MIEDAYQQTDAPFYDAGQLEEMKRARMERFRPSEPGAYNNPYSMDSSISRPEQKGIRDYRSYGFLGRL